MKWNYIEDRVLPTVTGEFRTPVIITLESEDKTTGVKTRWVDKADYVIKEGKEANNEQGYEEFPVSKFTMAGGDWDCAFCSGNNFETTHYGYCEDKDRPVRVIAWMILEPAREKFNVMP